MSHEPTAPVATSSVVGFAGRVRAFARSEMFDRTYREGMGLVEETAAYLDGPGRAASSQLSRNGALAYAAESMRLTTRLMQVASWLLVQRAVREGEMAPAEAGDDKYRLAGRARYDSPVIAGSDELPAEFVELMTRAHTLFSRVQRLDCSVYASAETLAGVNPVGERLARLSAQFGAPLEG